MAEKRRRLIKEEKSTLAEMLLNSRCREEDSSSVLMTEKRRRLIKEEKSTLAEMMLNSRRREEESSVLMTEKPRRLIKEEKSSLAEMLNSSSSSSRCREEDSSTEKRSWRMNEVLTSSDVWMDIFLRLPATADLLSLKAVCKTFHQLISSELFFLMNLKKNDFKSSTTNNAIIISTHPTSPNLLYDPENRSISVWHNESMFDNWCTHHHACRLNKSHRVLDSYLGRLLLVRLCGGRLLICSPIKSSYHLLPSISPSFSLQFPCWKIAYDDVSQQYKVFGLDIINRNQVSLYVFDGKSHLHRKTTTSMLQQVAKGRTYNVITQNVLVNNNVYWLIVAEETKKRQLQWECVVVSANVTTEEVKARICPPTPFPVKSDILFFVANGTFYFTYPSVYFNLWFLEGIETSTPTWTMKPPISVRTSDITSYHTVSVLGLFHNKLLFKIIPGQQYYQYDPSRGKVEKVRVAKADYIEPELIGDDTKCEMSMGPIDIATQVSVGFIPCPI